MAVCAVGSRDPGKGRGLAEIADAARSAAHPDVDPDSRTSTPGPSDILPRREGSAGMIATASNRRRMGRQIGHGGLTTLCTDRAAGSEFKRALN